MSNVDWERVGVPGSESVYLGASRDTWERVRGVTRSQNFDQNEPKYYCKAVSSKFPTEINETVVLGTIRSNFEGLWATGSIFQVAAPEARDWSRTRSGAYRWANREVPEEFDRRRNMHKSPMAPTKHSQPPCIDSERLYLSEVFVFVV